MLPRLVLDELLSISCTASDHSPPFILPALLQYGHHCPERGLLKGLQPLPPPKQNGQDVRYERLTKMTQEQQLQPNLQKPMIHLHRCHFPGGLLKE